MKGRVNVCSLKAKLTKQKQHRPCPQVLTLQQCLFFFLKSPISQDTLSCSSASVWGSPRQPTGYFTPGCLQQGASIRNDHHHRSGSSGIQSKAYRAFVCAKLHPTCTSEAFAVVSTQYQLDLMYNSSNCSDLKVSLDQWGKQQWEWEQLSPANRHCEDAVNRKMETEIKMTISVGFFHLSFLTIFTFIGRKWIFWISQFSTP